MLDRLGELLPEFAQDQKRRSELEAALRKEFGGKEVYVASGMNYEAVRLEVLRRYNGCNASSLAREFKVGRTSVYRWIEQSRNKK